MKEITNEPLRQKLLGLLKEDVHAIPVRDNSALQQPVDEKDNNSQYECHEIILDVILFFLASWSQFGYSLYTQQNSFASISDPMAYYLYPHITLSERNNISNYLKYITTVFSFADAALTTGTYINMRKCRKELIVGLRKGIQEYKNNNISPVISLFSTFLILGTFVSGSFPPLTGLERNNYSRLMIDFSGPTMFSGLMISYLMSYAPYVFSAAKNFANFYKLDRIQKKKILQNIFYTKKGLLGFLPRSVLSVVNRSLVWYGSANLTATWVFRTQNPLIRYPYAIASSFASGYQTFMSQGIKDYEVTFYPPETKQIVIIAQLSGEKKLSKDLENQDAMIVKKLDSDSPSENIQGNMITCKKIGYYSFTIILSVLTIAVFLLRTLAVPSLYTGEIDDPANNYSKKDAALGILGLIFGGYAAFQYSRFRYSRWQDNCSSFFHHDSIKPLSVKNDGKTVVAMPHVDMNLTIMDKDVFVDAKTASVIPVSATKKPTTVPPSSIPTNQMT